jgi:deoxyribodipyrimidine photo-lyase
MDYDDADMRHWRFIYESILDLQSKLNPINRTFYYFHNEVQTVFSELVKLRYKNRVLASRNW